MATVGGCSPTLPEQLVKNSNANALPMVGSLASLIAYRSPNVRAGPICGEATGFAIPKNMTTP
jgi:hypothetical protein